MKKPLACAGILFLLMTLGAGACINTKGDKYHRQSWYPLMSGVDNLRTYLKQDPRQDGVKMEAELRGAKKFEERSDYSVALLYLGRHQEAVKLLQRLEKEKPGEYFVAGNLGTALELSGNNEAAVQWIKEEIRRNPEAHMGTEWLHVKILEAKIARQKDAFHFKKNSVLGLESRQLGGMVTIDGKQMSAKTLKEAIAYQLAERLQFVKPPDGAVASLIFDFAAIEAATATLESAKGVLQLAMEYGYPAERVEPLLKSYERRILWRKAKGYGRYVLVGGLIVTLLGLVHRRRAARLASGDLKRG